MATENLTVVAQMRGDLAREAKGAERAVGRLNDELTDGAAAGFAAAAGYQAADAAADDLGDSMGRSRKEMRKHNKETDESSKLVDLLTKRLAKVAVGFGALGVILKGLKLPAIAGGISLIAVAASSLTAALVGMLGAMGPVFGILAALPGSLLALGGGFAAVKLGFKGIGEAMEAIASGDAEKVQEALAGMHPEAKSLAYRLQELSGEMDKVRLTAAGEMLPGVRAGFEHVVGLMPIFHRWVKLNARVVGRLAEAFGEMFSSASRQRDLNALAGHSARVFEMFGQAVLNLVDFFVDLMHAAQPLTEWFMGGLASWTGWLAGITKAGRETGRLREFFRSTMRVTEGLMKGMGDLLVALKNTFTIGSEYGGELGNRLGDLLARWRAWTESVEGQRSIKKWFDDARPVMDAFFSLLTTISTAFRDMATSAEHQNALVDLFEGLETTVGEFMQMVDGLDVGALVDTVLNLVDAYINFSDALSFNPLVAVVGTMAGFVNVLAKLMEKAPVLGHVVAWLLTLKTIAFAGGLVAQFTGVTKAIELHRAGAIADKWAWVSLRLEMLRAKAVAGVGWIRAQIAALGQKVTLLATSAGQWLALKTRMLAAKIAGGAQWVWGMVTALTAKIGALARASAAWLAMKAKIVVTTVATKAAAAGQWLLNAALTANPIGLVVAAIALLVGGLVMAYKRSETFRNIVQKVWEWIKKAAVVVKDFFLKFSPLGILITKLGGLEGIADKIGTAFEFVKDMVGGAIDKVRDLADRANNIPLLGRLIPGDTATSHARGRGGLASTLGHHASIDSAVPGQRAVSNIFMGGGGRGRGSGDHQAGRALDLVGSGLNAYAKQVKAIGGYAAFHGSGGGRHLHAVYPAGDTATSRAGGTVPRPGGNRGAGAAISVTVAPGAVVVHNPSSNIDVKRAVAEGIADHFRTREERAVYR